MFESTVDSKTFNFFTIKRKFKQFEQKGMNSGLIQYQQC
jgi:hypothetical protein